MREPERIRFATFDCTFHCSQFLTHANNARVTAVTSMTTLTLFVNERSVELERAFFLTFQIL
jgi:hypothetical protein